MVVIFLEVSCWVLFRSMPSRSSVSVGGVEDLCGEEANGDLRTGLAPGLSLDRGATSTATPT